MLTSLSLMSAIPTIMLAFLSFSARSCRGFRSSSSVSPFRLQQSHVSFFENPRALSSLASGRPYNSRRRLDGNDHRRHKSSNKSRSLSLSQNSNNNLITSPKSQTVKKIQALLSKRKKRLEFGQTIVEGPRMVFDLLDNPKTTNLVRQVLVSAREYELREDYRSRLFGNNNDQDVFVQLVHPDVFPDCTDTISPQGIVAIVDIPDASTIHNAATTNDGDSDPVASATAAAPMYLVLDGVSDPGNLGTLLRTSLAVGVAGVVLLPDCCDVWNPKAVRSAMGASFQIPILESPSWNDALSTLHTSKGVQSVYAATMIENEDGDDENAGPNASLPYFDVDWTEGPSALVIGSEGNGLSSTVRQDLITRRKRKTTSDGDDDDDNGDIVVGATHIPMGAGIESLNAAVCGSVILFEYARQCQRPP